MATIEEQIRQIEEEIKRTQYNKATEHHVGRLKAKLARLKRELEKRRGRAGCGFSVKKSGHATVAIVGLPSTGKSTLLNALTGARSVVGHYYFTTLSPVPGVLHYRGAKIQIIDLPGLIEGASRGRGMGREVISAARAADLLLLLVDVFNPDPSVLIRELSESGIRLNKHRPDISITLRERGGIRIASTVEMTKMSEGLAADVLRSYGYVNADVVFREDVDVDQLIDHLAGNRVYVPAILVLNKVDLMDSTLHHGLDGWDVVKISALKGIGVDDLKEQIFQTLSLMRIYLKPQGDAVDLEEPLILRVGSTIGDVCDALHRDFRRRFRFAHIWGPSAKFPGQTVGMDHRLRDGDVVSIIIRR